MDRDIDRAINSLKCCKSYCNTFLNKPTGVYSADVTIMANVINSYIKEAVRYLKNE